MLNQEGAVISYFILDQLVGNVVSMVLALKSAGIRKTRETNLSAS